MRGLVALIICIVSCAVNGCVPGSGIVTIHPHSEVTAPTFCLYDVQSHPVSIQQIRVYLGAKVNDERMEWSEWKEYSPVLTGFDHKSWVLEFAPNFSDPLARPFACITYGKPPPGYEEKVPVLPLIPERFYFVSVWGKGGRPSSGVSFIIRTDSSGRAIKLEYRGDGGFQVITQP